MPDQTVSDFLLLAGLAGFLIFFAVAWHIMRRSRRRRLGLESSLDAGGLKVLEKKQLLTPEEMKRVREAMARQYLEEQKAKEEAEIVAAGGLKSLSLEAERLEREARRRASKERPTDDSTDAIPALAPERQEHQVPEAARREAPPPKQAPSESVQLPPHLRAMFDKPEGEIEDLRNAGFLTEEDYRALMEARRKVT